MLVVDDDAALLAAVGDQLSEAGYQVTMAPNGEAAICALAIGGFDLVLTDVSMPGLDGVDVLKAVRARDRDLPVLFLTGTPRLDTAIEAVALGASQYLVKPVSAADLQAAVARAVAEGRRQRQRPLGALLQVESLEPLGLVEAFERAVTTLWIAWQPLFRAGGGLFGHEALVRNREPALLRPAQLLAAADRLRRTGPLGETIRARISAEPRAFAAGLVFVNLVPSDLEDPSVLGEQHPLSSQAGSVVLEITEQAPLGDLGAVRRRLADLRAAGFRIALDDLGAGHSNLNSFAVLEPDFVKLDMALVRDVDREPVKRRLVRAMVETCHDLGIAVVAEGVERPGELDVVTELGCDLVQGFLLGKPVATPRSREVS